mmetsp:Transcript_17777/g.2464  ORF Transcript_17777/g.2464 Transcript_17777/m.2464 type:complete len:115 (+) Transcript_17777:160-504(+)
MILHHWNLKHLWYNPKMKIYNNIKIRLLQACIIIKLLLKNINMLTVKMRTNNIMKLKTNKLSLQTLITQKKKVNILDIKIMLKIHTFLIMKKKNINNNNKNKNNHMRNHMKNQS